MTTHTMVLILGAVFAVTGIILSVRKGGRAGKNSIKMLGFEFQVAGAPLVFFTMGCVLVLAGGGLLSDANPQPAEKEKAVVFVASTTIPMEHISRSRPTRLVPAAIAADRDPELLVLTKVEFGVLDNSRPGFQVTLRFKNTSSEAMTLNVELHHLRLKNSRSGDLIAPVAIPSPRKNTILDPGETRDIVAVFDTSGWHDKETAAKEIDIEVNGLAPIEYAQWTVRAPRAGPG